MYNWNLILHIRCLKRAYLETDLGKRSQILEYHPNDQDEVRRTYLMNKPCKIKLTEYESTDIGGRECSFQYSWHEEYDWLEYSANKYVVFCLSCYVCYDGTSNFAFVVAGFKGWNIKHKLNKHVSEQLNSHHKKCVKACEDLMKKKLTIEFSYAKYSSKKEVDYFVRLKASLEVVNLHGQFGVSRIVTFLRSSNKRQALLQNKQVAHLANLIEKELVETGTDLNQELSITRDGDTSLGSHFQTLNRLVDLFTPIIEVFEDLKSDSHLGVNKKGGQHIVHAMELVQICKKKLQEFRDGGWETLYEQVVASCGNVEIDVPDIESRYVKDKKSKRLAPFVTNFHHFKTDCFLHVINVVLKELNDRFTPKNTELINCVTYLSLCYSFESFDVKSLVRLARLYPNDFEDLTDKELSSELETYMESVKMDDHFSDLTGISELYRTLVRTKKHKTFRFVYTLVKLALSLPVATASVERVFSGMKYVKNELRSKMANPWLK
ncbi:uncharacterized protein LOC131637909 [Vicia villosa]|uniref:uncharacterized protein LOC131637909 n=1 Tax=Vicia villosa TaxID=3911 RepID=UPI00273A967A|nr:uncharacterized protein LOC131637909 [Vicia villosa]